jgi:hypothetical protein
MLSHPIQEGRYPRNRPKVSKPKAKPFAPGTTFAAAQSVMGMVILKRNTANVPQTGIS